MAIITFTSDLGDSSHYSALLKGVVYSLAPQAVVIDITHNVPNFDVMNAAYVVRSTSIAYPPGSVHVLAVDPERGDSATGVLMQFRNQYFIGPDNGVLSLIAEGEHHLCRELRNEDLFSSLFPRSFRAARMYAPVAAYLANGGDPARVGPAYEMKELKWGEPTYYGNSLRGKIIHIDKFGNVITNIRKPDFLRIKNERPFEIIVRNYRLKRIVTTYSDVDKGHALALFAENEHLELAMREQPAAELLGLKVHDMITIEFRE